MKIYFNNLPVFLEDPTLEQADASIYKKPHTIVCVDDLVDTQARYEELIPDLMRDKPAIAVDAVFLRPNHATSYPAISQQFLQNFRSIEAAGGVVFNEKQEVLLIYRNEKWDLPKGKIEEGETVEVAAIREVEEETGLQNVELKEPIYPPKAKKPVTYHTYVDRKGQNILKTTYWFKMHCHTVNQTLTPQTEEGITQVAWIRLDQLAPYLAHTYPSIKDVIQGLLSTRQK